MEIIIGKTAGFCYGVSNAVNKTIKVLEENPNSEVNCLGEIVHNKQVVQQLEDLDLNVVENIEELGKASSNEDIVIIRAHGVSKDVYQKIEELQYKCVDLTCPNVLNIHKIAKKYLEEGYYIILIGQKNHPEVLGTYGWCEGKCSIIETEEDIKEVRKKLKYSKILVLGQTTFSLEKFNYYIEIIKSKFNCEIEVKNTICQATKVRQDETEKMSKQVDLMIIIGGKNSSNTRKLYDIASKHTDAICVETAEELDFEKLFFNKEIDTIKVGIMAGASTPQKSIDDVEEALKNYKCEKICN